MPSLWAKLYIICPFLGVLRKRLPLSPGSWISRYLAAPDVCDKGNFARMLRTAKDLCCPEPNETGEIDKQWESLPFWDILRLAMKKEEMHTTGAVLWCSSGPKSFQYGDRNCVIGLPQSKVLMVISHSLHRPGFCLKSSKTSVQFPGRRHDVCDSCILLLWAGCGARIFSAMYIPISGATGNLIPLAPPKSPWV